MKRIGIILIVLVLLLSGCNQQKQEEIKLIVEGEEISTNDFLDLAEKEIEDGALEDFLSIFKEEPVIIDTSELSEDEYRIRSVFEGPMFTVEDPNNGEMIVAEDAVLCNIYDSLIRIRGYNKPIENFNSSSLAKEISEISNIKLDYCYVPKYKHTVSTMLYGTIENSKYLMLGGDVETSQNSNIYWSAIEANNGTSAKEVATLYTEMDNIKLESHILDEKTVFHFSGEEGWFLSRYFGVKEFSTAYLWNFEDVVCAVIVPGEHDEKNFELCNFVKADI